MAIISASDLKTALRISGSSQDTLLTALAAGASSAVKSFIKYDPESSTETRYYTGNNYPNLYLGRRPVTAVSEVNYDPEFTWAAATALEANVNYRLDIQSTNYSASGEIILLRYPSNLLQSWPLSWGPNPAWSGGLTYPGARGCGWPSAPGALKVIFTGGFPTIPDDMKQAAVNIGTFLYNTQPQGGLIDSGSYIDTSWSSSAAVESLSTGSSPMLGSARSLLLPYRDLPFGLGP